MKIFYWAPWIGKIGTIKAVLNSAHILDQYSKNINMQDIGLFWQLTLKTIEDLKTLGDETITLEMYVSQLIFVKGVQSEDKNFILEAFKKKDINNLNNKQLISNYNYDKLIKFRQFY